MQGIGMFDVTVDEHLHSCREYLACKPWSCIRTSADTELNDTFLTNGAISSRMLLSMSLFPISTNRPKGAMHRHVASRNSPARLLRMTSTPRPPVADWMPSTKDRFRLDNMLVSGMS